MRVKRPPHIGSEPSGASAHTGSIPRTPSEDCERRWVFGSVYRRASRLPFQILLTDAYRQR
jgi:hypothetical protein